MWGYLFGSGAKKDQAKNSIISLREQIDTLSKREKHFQKQIEELEATARKNVTTNKAAARTALKRKKEREADLDKTQAQIDSLQQQLHAIENAKLNYETMKIMSQGAQAMKHIHGNMNIDKVDATMDDIRDQVALGEEISDAISRPLGQEVDEDDLNEELEALEQEALDAKMVNAGKAPVHNLPTQQLHEPEPAVEEDDEEEELRKLQAEMAL
ncbi:ESCRT-III subunit protein SNF7 [Sugiyamaella lignohabitans]|uniref:Vacuolar-sorting protein SNF7 n=1 Tax=Sugiyamaella lignohabitans TaxID=796027 RepID=A0A167E8X3_9ASCO|nr:ESCRT-III subunit protein SNF7 [Sugiyamaella lignohabitans]ANB13785.1 ESCRT-III subunit protein SNF7 [Sugiyamaella lignohabitans]